MKECSRCGVSRPIDLFVGRYGEETKSCAGCRKNGLHRSARHKACNPDSVARRQGKYHASAAGKSAKKGQKLRYRARHPDRVKRSGQDWRARNAATVTSYSATRRAMKLQATPAWSDRAEMKRVYALAREQRLLTGETVHVDHQVPLQHPDVCGLHVPANLAIVLGTYNCRKNNRTWPGMWPTEFTDETGQVVDSSTTISV